MGQLILCKNRLASEPYYLENINKNLYSLEEFCYYLVCEEYQIEPDFINLTFCDWVRSQLCEEQLALELEEDLEKNRGAEVFLKRILFHTQYAKEEEIQEFLKSFEEYEQRNETERKKLRADRLLRKEQYVAAIEEYQKLLKAEEVQADSELEGNILHNIGTAYAGLFFFEQAAEYYKKAYGKNANQMSLEAEFYALKLAGKEEKIKEYAKENDLNQTQLAEYGARMNRIYEKEYELSERVKRRTDETIDEVYEEIAKDQIRKWKTDYERYCRL